ncbi:MAG: CBS domain-containing protein [Desulfobacterales bacterium]
MKVNEIMTGDIATVTTNDSIKTAAEKMKELDVGDIPVVLHGDTVGMITDRDVTVRAVAKGLDPEKTHVIDVMTKDVIACNEQDDVGTAVDLMRRHKIRRLLVMSEGKKLSGVISLKDVALNLDKDAVTQILRDVST